MIISVIVAISENNVIGKDGKIPWHLPQDLKYFKKVTMGHHIVMGRKTYESIGRPLPGRENIVVTKQEDYKAEGCTIVHSLGAAIAIARMNSENELFIIGGSSIYETMMPDAQKLYLTKVFTTVEDGDAFFPAYDKRMWIEANSYPFLPDDEHKFAYTMMVFERRM